MDPRSPTILKVDFNDDFHLERLPTPRTPPVSYDHTNRALPHSPPPSERGSISHADLNLDPNFPPPTAHDDYHPVEYGRPPTPSSLNGDVGNNATQTRPMTNAELLQKMQEMRVQQMRKRDSGCSLERKPRVKKSKNGGGKERVSSIERTAKGKGKAKASDEAQYKEGNSGIRGKRIEEERPTERIMPTWRGSSVMTPAQEYSEYIIVDVGDRELPHLLVCLKQSQGFAWNTDEFLPRFIRSSNSRDNLEKMPDPITNIVLPDECNPETSPFPSWYFE